VSGTQGPHIPTAEEQARHRPEVVFLHRLEALERENRRLGRYSSYAFMGLAVLLGLIVALVWVSGRQGAPGTVAEEVAARQFVLRDKTGAIRGAWGVGEDGAVRLALQDPKGRPRVKVSLLQDGTSGLSFSDSAGRSRAVFALLPDQTGSMAFADEAGKTRSVLGISPDGAANIVFADRSGSTRAGIGVDAGGRSTFTLADRIADAAPAPAPAASEPPAAEVPDSQSAAQSKGHTAPKRKH
jgi:hypothetical protein